MAKKRKDPQIEKEEVVDYYKLNTDAVDRLVNASEETAPEPEVGDKQPNPYKMGGFLSRIPNWIKALFIKFWFNGAACFFFLWGLSIYIQNDIWLQIIILGVALGVITDLLVNNLFRFMQSDERENDKWMLIPIKGYWTFIVNIVYALVLMIIIVYAYQGINVLINNIKGAPSTSIALGVEPFSFGIMYLALDMAFIGIKDGIVYGVRKARKNKLAQSEDLQVGADVEQPQEEKPTVVVQAAPSAKKCKKK